MKSTYLYLILLAAIVVVSIAAYLLTQGGGSPGNGLASFDNQKIPQSLSSQLSVSASESSGIGMGIARITSKSVNATALTLNGKPEILYIGTEFCPYCALTRWGLVVALLRFGNLTGLEYMTSSHSDVGADTPTFTFVNATYSSQYISFVSVETEGNKEVNGSYPAIQKLSGSQLAILGAFDQEGSIPFIDFANQSAQVGANYNDLTILANRNWTDIASQLHNQSSVIAKAVVGSADIFTAQICAVNGNVPASVCNQPYVQSIETSLK